MLEKFGLMKTVEELNKTAEGFKNEGDEESLIALARENGIDEEDARDYLDGRVDTLATPTMAAIGRLNAIKNEIKKEKNVQYRANQTMIHNILMGMLSEPEVAAGVLMYENIVMELVNGMKGIIYNGMDEDMRQMIRALCEGKDKLKEVAKKINKRYTEE